MIRAARPDDVPILVSFVRELAAFERAESEVELDETRLHDVLFRSEPQAYCLVATPEGSDEPVGFAVWFVTFSTWLGRHGVYLEDLYVRQQHRRGGHGRALLSALAQIGVERGYGRLEWSVLNWNVDAHAFYRSLGAAPQDEWTVWRLAGPALAELGSAARDPRGQ